MLEGIFISINLDGCKKYQEFVSFIAEYFLEQTKQCLKNGDNFETCIVSDRSANKVIKNILLLNEEFIDVYCD